MKNLILLVITLTTFVIESYASFPVSDTLQVKNDTLQQETVKEYHLRMKEMGFNIEDCRCEDCKKFKGNTKNRGSNNNSIFATLGILILVSVVIFIIWLVLWIARGLQNFSDNINSN